MEDQFEAAFELTAAAICEATLEGRFLRVSQKLCDMLGFSKDRLLRMALLELISDSEDRECVLAEQGRLLRGEIASYSHEARVRRNAKLDFWATLTVSRLATDGGRLLTLRVGYQAVNDRRRVEEALWESRGFARAAIDALATHLCVLDLHGSIVAVNRAWREFALRNGVADGATVGRNYLAICDAASEPGFADGLAFAAGIRSVISGELETFERELIYLAPGEQEWFAGKVSRFRSEGVMRIAVTRRLVTERKRAEMEARDAKEDLSLAVRAANVGLWDWDLDTDEVRYSPEWKGQLGYTDTEIGNSLNEWKRLVHPDYLAPSLALVEQCIKNAGLHYQTEFPMRHKDGSYRWVLATGSVVRTAEGRPTRLIGGHVDITARKRAEEALQESEAMFRQLADNLADAFWLTSVDKTKVHYVSPAYERIWGRSCQDLYADPASWCQAIHPDDLARIAEVARFKQADGGYDEVYRIVRPDGEVRWIRDRAFPVADESGRVFRIAGIVRDVTDRVVAQEQLVLLAHYDTLTGLPNRTQFYECLQQTLAQEDSPDRTVGVMLLDLDRFKLVNDTLAHAYGDRLLVQVAERLKLSVRSCDLVGRLGGDEFGVILPALVSPAEAEAVAQRIVRSFAEPFDLYGQEVFISASIGITFFTSAYEGVDTLIMNADVAMYSAKQQGRNNYQRYTNAMDEGALANLQLETRLRRALEKEAFVVHYQPKVGMASGRIAGLEALIRWQPEGEELVQPGRFIPLMEQTGLIVPAGEWLLRAVCKQLAAWDKAGIRTVPVAVNVSARQLQHPGFVDGIAKTLKEHGTDPSLIEFEITESSLMRDAETAIAVLDELKGLGISLAADDFGTGYSSLSYLKQFPLDALKIDRSFVRDATTDPDDAAIARAVITLGHSLGLRVVAEGVETPGQFALLRAIGCDEAQGYLFWRPLEERACTALLADGAGIEAALTSGAEEPPSLLIVDQDRNYAESLATALRDAGYPMLIAASSSEVFDLLATNRVGVVVSDRQLPDMKGVELLRRVKRMYPEVKRAMLSSASDFATLIEAINDGDVHRFFVKGDDEKIRAALLALASS